MKKLFKLRLSKADEVRQFVDLASSVDGEVMLKSGRWCINGKSILGVFSLDLSSDIDCEVEASEDSLTVLEEGLRKLKLI